MTLHRTLAERPLHRRLSELGSPYVVPVTPEPVYKPVFLHASPQAAALLDVDVEALADPDWVAVMAGEAAFREQPALATVYAGHQFGVFVPQLGDGRAMVVGEVEGADGTHWELQLKGAGRTPFSRFADGRAVLRSSIREYLCSEAMAALGIPTTRALCLIGSSEPVQRETLESAAIVCRMAPSHLRFGHFEYFYYRGQHEALKPLADHLIDHHFPALAGRPDRYAAWLSEVIDRTARLVAAWQSVGFCHGVLNTDNMSALGLTIDYGPYGFMDAFDSSHICNHSDEHGRYAYEQQPLIGQWNGSRLLQAALPLLDAKPEAAVEIAEGILGRYPPAYTGAIMDRWRAKFGFADAHQGDRELINRFLNVIDGGRGDFTRSFRMLGEVEAAADGAVPRLRDHLVDPQAFDAWLPDYRARLRLENIPDLERRNRMNRTNPRFVLRNHLAQAAIEDAANGSVKALDRLFGALARPYDEQPDLADLDAEPPADLRHLTVSCSS